jgi:hypothetical protein
MRQMEGNGGVKSGVVCSLVYPCGKHARFVLLLN